jgi:putative SOS response-associated peptidase YedK
VFALAGLWESHDAFESFAILTTSPNGLMRPIHDRMPVIVPAELHEAWLASGGEAPPEIPPYPADAMRAEAITRRVNSPRNDDASVLSPAGAEPGSDGPD